MGKKYIVHLTDVVNKGNAAAYRIKHATVPWKVDAGVLRWRDVQTAETFACTL